MDNTKNIQIVDPVFNIYFSPNFSEDKTCFAAKQSGLYRSTDGGQNWKNVFNSLQLDSPLSATNVVVSPDFEYDGHVFAAVQGGILRSEDHGDNWTISVLPSPPPFISQLDISPNYKTDGTLFAGTMDDGVFRSVDQGAGWTAWNFGLFDVHVLCIAISRHFSEDKTVFLGTESGVFGSLNGGLGWREMDFPIECAPVLSIALSPHFNEDRIMFCGTENSGLFQSVDAGKSWDQIASAQVVGNVGAVILSSQFPAVANIWVMSGDAVLFSVDSGKTWKSWGKGTQTDQQLLSVSRPIGIDWEEFLMLGFTNGDLQTVRNSS